MVGRQTLTDHLEDLDVEWVLNRSTTPDGPDDVFELTQ